VPALFFRENVVVKPYEPENEFNMDEVFKLFKGCVVPPEKFLRDEAGGVVISTVYAPDLEVYETAVLDRMSSYPVERYATREEAKVGHEKWVEKAASLTEVLALGFGSLIPDEMVTLVR
jgi:hypothetical protein